MCMAALIMRPWIAVVKAVAVIKVYILADDVMMIANGDAMTEHLAKAINKTHAYLHDLGARVAPDKKLQFRQHDWSNKMARRHLVGGNRS